MAGDGRPGWPRPSMTLFQSTPTNFMAGDAAPAHRADGRPGVSIHAHQFHGGRRDAHPVAVGSDLFQSTPTNFMAGDSRMSAPARPTSRFNPRPPISWRATSPGRRSARMSSGFNPRPPISWRATGQQFQPGQPDAVSIHAHQFHGGRRTRNSPPGAGRHVSIHAHQFHGGRRGLQALSESVRRPVSIHAHQFHGGRLTSRARGNKRP